MNKIIVNLTFIIVIIISGCIFKSEEENDKYTYYSTYEIICYCPSNYSIIVPIFNYSKNDDNYMLNKTGNNNLSIVNTEYGKGLSIIGSGSLYINITHEMNIINLTLKQHDYFYYIFSNISIPIFRLVYRVESPFQIYYQYEGKLFKGWNEYQFDWTGVINY